MTGIRFFEGIYTVHLQDLTNKMYMVRQHLGKLPSGEKADPYTYETRLSKRRRKSERKETLLFAKTPIKKKYNVKLEKRAS